MSSDNPKTLGSQRFEGMHENIWVEFAELTKQYNPVNLAQGFPDFAVPTHLKDAMITAVTSNDMLHQYTRGSGHPRLVKDLAGLYGPLLHRDIDPNTEIVVTCGAYESLYCSVMGLINPGDETIIIEPFYACYISCVKIAGGKSICIPLRMKEDCKTSADFYLDERELKNAISNKTKMLIINNPHNPTGKVFGKRELEFISELCIKHDIICVSDEVYEWLIYSESQHIRIATLPGMYDRTITIGSGGKAFCGTGWRIGWSIGPPHLIKHLQAMHTNSIFSCPTPLQEAIAIALETELNRFGSEECYFRQLQKMLEEKRNRMARFLSKAGIVPIIPEGGCFMMADVTALGIEFDDGDDKTSYDYKFSRWFMKEKGIACIPPSSFYSPEHKELSKRLIRFCFFKSDETMVNAEEKFNELINSLKTK